MTAKKKAPREKKLLIARHWGLAGLMALLCATTFVLGKAASPSIHHIRQQGYTDFSKGQLGNSGANLYVSRDGRIEVINKWDLNNDGYPDVLISADHDEFEGVDALIYWNGDHGFKSLLPDLWQEIPKAQLVFDLMDHHDNVTRLPAFGGGRSAIADFNRDGYPDIVFCNYIHDYPGVRTAYIYWGSANGYTISHRTELPTNWADGVAAADLNGDGYPDLVFSNEGVEEGLADISPPTPNVSYIYWGSAAGFDPNKPTLLPTENARDVTIADVNRDGYPDICFVENSKKVQDVKVFLGSATGYSNNRTEILPVPDPTSIHSGDVNGDGYPDLIVTTAGKPLTIYTLKLGQAPNRRFSPVYIFLGSKNGIDPQRTIKLPSYQARDSCVGDFNKDGYPDIAFANNSDGVTPLVPSFVYWGSKDGFSPDRRTELPTLGATSVACVDLNHDGYVDLAFANSDNGKTYDVPSYIYWGSPSGFSPYVRTDLQTFGAVDVNVADLNSDGKPDLLFVNRYSGTVAGVNSHIFWGNAHHYYSTASMTSLPGFGSYGTTVADLNDDGYPDIVLCNSYQNRSYIYWGSKGGFSVEHRTSLSVGPAYTSHAADLNHDGYLDLVFGGVLNRKNVATIYWGSPNGFSDANKTVLHLKSDRRGASEGFQIADLNRDGYLDLVFFGGYFGDLQIFWGGAEGYSESRTWTETTPYGGELTLADLNGDGYLDYILSGGFDPIKRSHNARTRILWGTPAGTPSKDGAIELQGYGSSQCAVADLNRDGNLDIVCSNYMSDRTRQLPIFIFWGSKGGHYSDTHRTDLPAHSSLGLQVIDLNDDGYPDIVVHNHLNGTRHTNDSYIYWNSPQGFSLKRRTKLLNFGPHFSQMIDPGNLYTRKLEEDYISAPIEIPAGNSPSQLFWKGEESHGAKLKFQVRSAPNRQALAKARWSGPTGADSFYLTAGADLRVPEKEDRWFQYRTLFCSRDGGDWPVLTQVEIVLKESR